MDFYESMLESGLSLEPPTPSNVPLIPTITDHKGSIEGPLEGPGWDLGLGLRGRGPLSVLWLCFGFSNTCEYPDPTHCVF